MYLRKPGEATGKDLLLVYLKNSKVKMNDDDLVVKKIYNENNCLLL
jgi:hypothetical protein